MEQELHRLSDAVIAGDLAGAKGLTQKLLGAVGGAAVTQRFADEIGADAYGANAAAAVDQA